MGAGLGWRLSSPLAPLTLPCRGMGAYLASTEGNGRSALSLPHWYYTGQVTWSASPASMEQGCGGVEDQLSAQLCLPLNREVGRGVQFYSWYLVREGSYYQDCFLLFSQAFPDQLSRSDFSYFFFFFVCGCWWFWVGNFCSTLWDVWETISKLRDLIALAFLKSWSSATPSWLWPCADFLVNLNIALSN